MAITMGKAVAFLDLDVTKYKRGFASAREDLKVFKSQSATVEQKMRGLSSALGTTGSVLTKSVTAPLVAMGGVALKVTSDFDAGMSQVQAISGATGEQLKLLEDKAIQMGAKTKFSAKESADAFKYMAMAGWETEDMLQGIDGVMSLAAASGEDLALTSDIVTDSLTAFGLSAKDASHFADVLAQTSSKSNTNVALLGDTFKYVAPVAGALGYTVEDTAVAIGLMANAGIKGSMAGTALRSLMVRLTKPTEQVANAMEKYGISITDANGNMKPLNTLLTEMRGVFNNLTDAQKSNLSATLAGQEGMSGLLAIMNASEQDFVNLTKQVNNANGSAEKMAKTMQNNLKGSVEQFKGALESTGIIIGKKLTPEIDKIVKKGTKVVESFNNMSDAEQENILKLLKIAAVTPVAMKTTSSLLKVFGGGISKVKNFVKNINDLKSGIEAYKLGMTDVAIEQSSWLKNIHQVGTGIKSFLISPIGFATTSLVAMGTVMAYSVKQTQDYKNEISKLSEEEQVLSDAINESAGRYYELQKAREEMVSSADKEAQVTQTLWEKLNSVVDENGKVLAGKQNYAKFVAGELSKSLGQEVEIIDGQVQGYKELKQNIDKVIDAKKAQMIQESMGEQYTEALKEQTNAILRYNEQLGYVADTEQKLKQAEDDLAKANENYKRHIKEGTGVLNPYYNEVQRAGDKVDAYRKKLKGQNEELEKAKDEMIGYNETIQNYDVLGSAIISGNAEQIEIALLKVQKSFQTATTGTKESLEEQAKTLAEEYEKMKIAMEEGNTNITEETLNNLKELSTQANNELKEKLEQDKQTLVSKFNEVGIQAPQELINRLVEKDAVIQQQVSNILTNMKNGVSLKSPEIIALFKQLGIDAPDSLGNKLSEMNPNVQRQAVILLAQLMYAEQSQRPKILQQLRDLGINIDTSLAGGIESNTGVVKQKAGTVGTQGNTEFKINFEKEKAKAKIDEKTNADEIGEKARKSLASWFEKPIKATLSLLEHATTRDGSHAGGLDYVPYNGYRAELHEGERVLTKQQNKEYNRGIKEGTGDTFNFYNTKPNPYEYARQMKKAKRELLYDF